MRRKATAVIAHPYGTEPILILRRNDDGADYRAIISGHATIENFGIEFVIVHPLCREAFRLLLLATETFVEHVTYALVNQDFAGESQNDCCEALWLTLLKKIP